MIPVLDFWKMVDEALNDEDDTELMSVINSFTPEQWAAWAKEALNENEDQTG